MNHTQNDSQDKVNSHGLFRGSSGLRELMAHWAQVLRGVIHEVRFEALIKHQEKTACDLLTYCGLDGYVRSATEPVSSGRVAIGHWEHYSTYVGPLLKALDGEEPLK